MKNFKLLLFVCALLPNIAWAGSNIEKTNNGISFVTQGMDFKIEFYTDDIVRVHKTPTGMPCGKESLVVDLQKSNVGLNVENMDGMVEISSPALIVKVNTKTGGIRFLDKNGRNLILDKDYGTSFSNNLSPDTEDAYVVRNEFLLDKDEPIYGLGQILDNRLSRRNSNHHLQNENMNTISPFFMSIKGYGVYFDNYSISDFEDNPQGLSLESFGTCSDYYFMYGKTADGVVAQMRTLTGKAPMLPLWAYGFFQSKERYKTQDESLEVLKKYRDLNIPIDCIIQDWRYWPEYENDSIWNSFSFDKKRFPDPKKWIDEIHKLNAKLMIVAWPCFAPYSPQRKTFEENGMLLDFISYPPKSGVKPYDVFNPKAREIYWDLLNKGIYSYINNDGWWLDSTEPDHMFPKPEDYELKTYMGTYKTVKNAYSLLHNKEISTRTKAANKDKRVVILTRSGFVGQQEYGSITWSGDVRSTWENLEKQIPAALSFSLMGLPYWNSDIGGFQAYGWHKQGGTKCPEYQELYLRWMQFGFFSTMMRSHGTGLPREIWRFGEKGDWCFDAQEKCINLRYALLPYIYSTSWNVSKYDGTFMRALFMDFPEDKNTHNLGSQFLFGKSIMVVPVTKYNVDSWKIYLPQGVQWYDYWTNEIKEGGEYITRNVDKATIPLYIKAGSIIPFGPKVQYSTQKKWDNLTVKVYPGKDGDFILYEDEFDNYNYENGYYTEIKFSWNDDEKTLVIGDRSGKYKGMISKRKFTVELPTGEKKVVSYSGKKKEVKF